MQQHALVEPHEATLSTSKPPLRVRLDTCRQVAALVVEPLSSNRDRRKDWIITTPSPDFLQARYVQNKPGLRQEAALIQFRGGERAAFGPE